MFIALAGAIALITALVLALPFLRGQPEATARAAYDAQAYRAQLTEIDQDVMRGVLTETEAKAAKIEISRRLLAATDEMEAAAAQPRTPAGLKNIIGIGAGIGTPVLATAIYLAIGEPGRPDMPLASRTDFESQMAQRPSQSQAEALFERSGYTPDPVPLNTPETQKVAGMIEEVEAVLARNPDDTRGRVLLARTQRQLGRYADAWRNYAILVEGMKQPDLEIYGEMVEAMVSATNGYVSPQAETITDRALALAPEMPRFRHFKAMAIAQQGDSAEALVRWSALLKDATGNEPWVPLVYGHAEEMANALGVPPPPLPAALATPGAPGPSQAEIAAAAEMPESDRNAMIEGMVMGLAERLAEDPDDLQGWLRLIRAYTVLGRDEQRDKAVEMARNTFTGDSRALERIEDAAR